MKNVFALIFLLAISSTFAQTAYNVTEYDAYSEGDSVHFLLDQLNLRTETDSSFNEEQTRSYFDITNFQKGDTVMLGFRSSNCIGRQYKNITLYKYRNFESYLAQDLSFKTFVIKRTGTGRRFSRNEKYKTDDYYIRFGKKGMISRKDYFANLNDAIKSGEIISDTADVFDKTVNPDSIGALTFYFYIKSNNYSADYFAKEYHYYFMAHKFKIDGYWENNPEYTKLLKLAVKTINETIQILDYKDSYSFITVFNIGSYDRKENGYTIKPRDSIFIPIPGYHDAPGTKIILTNINDFSFLPVKKNYTYPFVNKRNHKKDYFTNRIYAKVNLKFLNRPDEKRSGHYRSVYAEIENIEFFNDRGDIYYWIATIHKK
jgi:hypothetical protein